MRSITRISAGLAVAAALTAAVALPAQAADTDVTVEVTGGTLNITAPSTASLHGAVGGTATGSIGGVTVSDQRALSNGSWSASYGIGAFEKAGSGETIVADGFSYGQPVLTAQSAGSTITLTAPPAGAAGIVASATVSGNNTATWGTTLSLAIPVGTTAGTYAATLTHSVL
jgi:hypothetical protein